MQIRVKHLGPVALALAAFSTAIGANEGQHPADAQVQFEHELLEAHNAVRTDGGVRPLEWSPQLAAEAQGWANHLSKRGYLQHASIQERGGRGENLWMGTAGYFSLSAMIGYFAAEKQHFRPGTFPNVSRTGNWADVGHYTQMIWGETRQVGCAVARGVRDEFLVCRYWPAGNTYGRKVG